MNPKRLQSHDHSINDTLPHHLPSQSRSGRLIWPMISKKISHIITIQNLSEMLKLPSYKYPARTLTPINNTKPHFYINMVCSCEVQLYGMWASPAVRRVEWALKMKGIEYEYIEEDLTNKSASLLEYNPINKQVPVLVHNGKPIVESLVIIEYIDEVWKTHPILPIDPHERAAARVWASFAEDKCRAACKEAFFVEAGESAEAIRQLEEVIGKLEKELKGKKFFGGESIGYLDLVAGWMAFWLGVAEEVACFKAVNPKKFPRFAAWIVNFLQVPVIKQNLPPRDKTVEFFHDYRQVQLAASK